MLQYLPGFLSILRIHDHPMLKRLYLEIPLLLWTHPPLNSIQSDLSQRADIDLKFKTLAVAFQNPVHPIKRL